MNATVNLFIGLVGMYKQQVFHHYFQIIELNPNLLCSFDFRSITLCKNKIIKMKEIMKIYEL